MSVVPSPVSRYRPRLTRMLLLVADAWAILVAVILGILLRNVLGGEISFFQAAAMVPLVAMVLAIFWVLRLYAELPPGPSEELRRVAHGTTLGFVLLVVGTFFLRGGEVYSRGAMVLAWFLAMVLVPAFRAGLRRWGVTQTWWGIPVVVLGAGRTAGIVLDNLGRHPELTFRVVGILDDDPGKHGASLGGVTISGPIRSGALAVASAGIRHVIVAMPGISPDRLRVLWRELGPHFPYVIVIPGLHGFASLWVEAKDLGGILGLEVRQSLLLNGPRSFKRATDVVAVVVGGLLISPLLLVLYLLVRWTSPGPVFYSQQRIGRDGRPFRAWKFRSMCQDADAVLTDYLAAHPELRAEWEADHKLRHDPRITWIGRLLRKSSLDELAQLWNVLKGDMSLVGPRPITAAEREKYGEEFEFYQRVRPGITGLWQVSGRNSTTYQQRVEFDAYYVHNWSIWLDVHILLRTVRTVIRADGAY